MATNQDYPSRNDKSILLFSAFIKEMKNKFQQLVNVDALIMKMTIGLLSLIKAVAVQ